MTETAREKIARLLLNPPPVAHYRAIGEFLVEFSRLEYYLKVLYFVETGAKDDVYDEVTTLSPTQMVTALKSIAKRRYPSERVNRFGSVLNAVRTANDDRNHIAHAFWEEDQVSGLADRFVSNSNLKPATKYRSFEDLEVATDKLRKLQEELLDAYLALRS